MPLRVDLESEGQRGSGGDGVPVAGVVIVPKGCSARRGGEAPMVVTSSDPRVK